MKKTRIILLAVLVFALIAVLAACAPRQRVLSQDGLSLSGPDTQTGTESEDGDEPEEVVEIDLDWYENSFEWAPNVVCAVCHIPQEESYSVEEALASKHTDDSCTLCHSDNETLTTVHAGKSSTDTMTTRLKKTTVKESTCLTCHFMTKEALLEETPDIVITDSYGKSVNPHDLPTNTEHQQTICRNCHGMHKDTTVQKQARNYCLGCHHEDAFECYTCHS